MDGSKNVASQEEQPKKLAWIRDRVKLKSEKRGKSANLLLISTLHTASRVVHATCVCTATLNTM